MGFFTKSFTKSKLDKMREIAFAHGVRKGDGVSDCESCSWAERADCITGVICKGRQFDDGTYLVVAEVYTCDEFTQGSGI